MYLYMSAINVIRKRVKRETGKQCCNRQKYTVVYNRNNVNAVGGQVDTKVYASEETVIVLNEGTILSTIFGYVFKNWVNEKGVVFNPEDNFSIMRNTTLYAQYVYSPESFDPSALADDYFMPLRRLGMNVVSVVVYDALSNPVYTITNSNKRLNSGIFQFTQTAPFYNVACSNSSLVTVARAPNFTTYMAASITAASIIYNADNSTTLTSGYYGGNDTIVVKYNITGFAQWVASIHSDDSGNESVVNVQTDPFNNVYVHGNHTSGAGKNLKAYHADGTLYPSTIDSTSGESTNTFIVKYNPSGTVLGVASLQGISDQGTSDVATDTNFVYVAANTSTSVVPTFVNGAVSFPLTGIGVDSSEGFILKLQALGDSSAPLWYARVASAGSDVGANIGVDSTGNVYGLYTSTIGASIDFYDAGNIVTIKKTAVNTIVNSNLTALAKYNSNGTVQWAVAFNTAIVFNGQVKLRVDSGGNSYVMIRATSAIVVTDSTATDTTLTFPPTYANVNFLIKISPTGVYLDCAKITVSGVYKVNLWNNHIYVDFYYPSTNTKVFYASTELALNNSSTGHVLLKFTSSLTPSLVGYCMNVY